MKNKITILAVGDRADYDSFKKLHKEKHFILANGFNYASINYRHLLEGKIPKIKTDKVVIFLFFPFKYWDKYIEHKNYRGIYGSRVFAKKFAQFWKKADRIIKKSLSDKEVQFINDPFSCGFYRDKLNIAKNLAKSKIRQPKFYKPSSVKDVYKLLNSGTNLFLKTRCGSMGKGITFLSWASWKTNFKFKNNKIISRHSDKGWKFRDITANSAFLGQLLKKDILIEEAIDSYMIDNMKVDFRIYVFFNKVMFVYPRRNTPDKITTNITQGGKGDPKIVKLMPAHLISKAKKIAQRVSKSLGLNFTGLDIMIHRNRRDIYVLDVNTFPGFPKRKTFNLARYMVKELKPLQRNPR